MDLECKTSKLHCVRAAGVLAFRSVGDGRPASAWCGEVGCGVTVAPLRPLGDTGPELFPGAVPR